MSHRCFPAQRSAARRVLAVVTVVCSLALTLVAGCAPTAGRSAAAEPFVDDAGRQVSLKGIPNKIVSLSPSTTEVLYALGLGDRIVGVTEYDDYPPEVKSKPKIGGFSDVDAERVVALAPDLVFASSLHVAKVVPALEKLGLAVVVVDPKSIEDVSARFVTIGRLTGKDKEAQDLKAQIDKRIAATAARARESGKAPRVFWMLDEGLFTAGPGSFVDDLISKAGGTNVAADAKTQWPQLSLEAVLKADPEVIVIPGPDGPALAAKLKADPAWQSVAAVKAGRFVLISDVNLVSRPGPRIADGLDLLARELHPEQFK